MRTFFSSFLIYTLFFITYQVFGQVQPFYQDIDLSKTGDELFTDLSDLLINTHNGVSYSAVWNILQQADLDPDDTTLTDVLLVYGFDNSDGQFITDRTRDKNLNCNFSGSCTGYWNREHVFPQSLADPQMSTTSIGTGTDVHNLRACDIQANSQRGNNKFAPGSGNPFLSAPDVYYPGDEWKGDVARIILYMFLRYQEECLPTNVGNDSTTYDLQIPDIFLEWNAEDQVSEFEINRNEIIFGYQGNRNPFIDNPYLATLIWGGPTAENKWPINDSDIVFDTSFTTPENIPYIDYTTTSGLNTSNSIEVGRFILRDGGDSGELDTKSTQLTSLSFNVTGHEVINKAALYYNEGFVSELEVNQQEIEFSNLQIEALDGDENSFSLFVSFESDVTDKTQFVFRIREALANNTGTAFAYANAGAAETATLGNSNRIDVIATKLNFNVQPSDVNLQSFIHPSPVVQAVDENENIDVDFIETIHINTTANFTTNSVVSQQAVLGESIFDALAFDLVGPSFTLTASANGIIENVVSNSFAVIDAPVSMQKNEVFITEISDHPTFTLEFMELFNFSNKEIDLAGAKIVMLPEQTVWGFGASSGNTIASAVIPPKGFVIISRGSTLEQFEEAYGTLPNNTIFIQGTQGMFFAPSSSREWQLYQGGTVGTIDGQLIDDNIGFAVMENQRIAKNLYSNTFVHTNFINATPGSLDDLVYVDGVWVSGNQPDSTSEQKNVYFFDDYVLDSSFKAKEVGVKSDCILDINGNTIELAEHIHFESTANTSAQLANVKGGNVFGEAIVERYIPRRLDSARAFRFISSAVNNVSISDSWQNQTHITGAIGIVGEQNSDGLDYTLTGNPSLFTYYQQWNPVLETLNNMLTPGRGYRIFIRGDRSATLSDNNALATDVNLSAKGSLNIGNITAPDINTSPNGFSFIGNPYPSIVDLSQLNFGSGILSDYVYYWDPSLATRGAFVSIDINSNSSSVLDSSIPNPGSSSVNRFLQPGQAIIIQNDSSGNGYSITFTEDSKATEENSLQVFSITSTPYVNIRLYEQGKYMQGLIEQDATGIRFYDVNFNDLPQAKKLSNLNENLAFIHDNYLYSIYNASKPNSDEIYPLFIHNLSSQNYVFSFDIRQFDDNVSLYLQDSYLNQFISLDNDIFTYNFTVDQSIPESVSNYRFQLHYEVSNLDTDSIEDKPLVYYPNPAKDVLYFELPQHVNNTLLRIYTTNGALAKEQVLDIINPKLDVTQLQSGVYIIELLADNKRFIAKLVIE